MSSRGSRAPLGICPTRDAKPDFIRLGLIEGISDGLAGTARLAGSAWPTPPGGGAGSGSAATPPPPGWPR
ncbi:hypothetical protein [Lentzea californiensis]|uniref:hypothetical protein n=1 Tax=Lentzea californiensis TaxID=438851 RepID=UPI0021661EB8|nr:hypothetical protein [Lentzea californiensis]